MLDRIVAKTFTFAYGLVFLAIAGYLSLRYGAATRRPSQDEKAATKRSKSFPSTLL